jgi:hypothetical protein
MTVPGTNHENCLDNSLGDCHWYVAYVLLRAHITDPRMAACPAVHMKSGTTVIEAMLADKLNVDFRTLKEVLDTHVERITSIKSAETEAESPVG